MTEEDLLKAVINLTDVEQVRELLRRNGASSELRLRAEDKWKKLRAEKQGLKTSDDPIAVESNSIQIVNTVLFENPVDRNDGPEIVDRTNSGKPVNSGDDISCHGDIRLEPALDQPVASNEPQSFGRYQTRGVLGSGAFGKVYLGFDPQLDRQVAIKVPKLKIGDAESRAQFLMEARQLAALKHPGIVAVYDISVDENQCYIVSDYLEGESLSSWLKSHKIDWPQVAQIAIKIADALAHAHSQRIVHRDLKPANIIMTDGQNPVLVDFGLAISDSSSIHNERGMIAGTPSFMSPEQARGEGHRIDGRTDIYALGVMMYQMLTGRLPFAAKRIEDLMAQVLNDEPQPPRQLNPTIPREMETVCLTAMAKSLRRRYTTAADLADDLRKILGQSQPYNSPVIAPQPQFVPHTTTVTPAAPPSSEHPARSPVRPETTLPPTMAAPQPSQSIESAASVENLRSASVSNSQSSSRRVREAERRRITIVKFSCDVFTSSEILESLDDEEQEEVLHEFQQLCRDATNDFGGTTAQLTEDGLRACFGYPVAFEDATLRAVRAGLKLIEKMTPLRDRMRRVHKVDLSGIAAIHSDHAIVQDTGEDGTLSIVGSLLNFVGQMDTNAEPNTVVMSSATFQLVQRFFDCESLGEKSFKGGPQKIYQVKAERVTGSPVDMTEPGRLTPLIGRDREVGLLQERWEQAVEGMGQVVLIIGDAGLGKSRLVHTLKEHVLPGSSLSSQHRFGSSRERLQGATIVEWRSSAQHHGSTLYPPKECFELMLGTDRSDSAKQRLDKLVNHLAELNLDGNVEIALLASMLSIPLDDRFPPLDINPQLQKEKTFELLWDWLRQQAANRPVLFVLEDLHWLDPTTLEFIEQVVAKGLNDRILILLTFRPEFVTPWKSLAHQTQVALNRLTKRQIGEMMVAKFGHAVPQQMIEQIAERTDGVPLFVEEFTQAIIESDTLSDSNDMSSSSWSSSASSWSNKSRLHDIPATLQDLLIARLDRMTINIEVAQLAATVGREFSYDVLQAVSSLSDTDLQIELKKMVAADLMSERGRPPRAKYTFKHALIQDAAYNSLIKKKRQQFHHRIGQVLESQFADTVETQPEILAAHFTEAGDSTKAIEYWEKAGKRSLERRAFKEAIQQLSSGLELLRDQPESPDRYLREIHIHTSLGVPLQATIGYSAPEVEHNYARAHELCGRLGLTTELFPVMYGMFRYYMLQAKYVRANDLAEQLVALSAKSNAADFVVASNRAKGSPLVYEGKHRQAIPYLERVASIDPTLELRAQVYKYDVVDPWIVASSYQSWAYWLLGEPDVAQKHSDDAIRIAKNLDHSFSLTLALSFSQWIHQFNRDVAKTREIAENALALAQEHGFAFWFGWCRIMRGWAMSQQGDYAKGIAEIEVGLVAWRAQGSELGSHYYYGLLAEACMTAGQLDKAATALDQAFQFAANTGEGFWLPEIVRLKGDLLLRSQPADIVGAESKFREALAIATKQDAKSLQLRASFSLAQHLASQGRASDARDTLEPICRTFAGSAKRAELDAAFQFLNSLAVKAP